MKPVSPLIPCYVNEAYSASEISKQIAIAPKNVRNQITKLQISVHEVRTVSGNETAFYLFTSLPREWQSRIEHYEKQKSFEMAAEAQEDARRQAEVDEIRKGRTFTPAEQEGLKRHQIAKARQIEDKFQRGCHYQVLANSVVGNARKDAEARDCVIRLCEKYLKDNGYKEEYKNLKLTWNYKAVQAFCAGIVSGEIEVPKEHEHIIIRKGQRSLTATSLLSWRDKGREMGVWGLASHQVKRRGQTILTTLQKQFIESLMYDFPHIRGRQAHKALKVEFAGVDIPSRDTVRRYMDYWKETNKSLFLYITNPDAWKNKYMLGL